MVDIQPTCWVASANVHRRIVRAMRRQGEWFHYLPQCKYVYTVMGADGQANILNQEEMAAVTRVLKPWERIECHWRRVVLNSIDAATDETFNTEGHA